MAKTSSAADLENTLYLELKDGRVVIELMPDKAPKTVARIKELVRQKFYDGIVFHRVISGFMAQTGDPTGSQFFICLAESSFLDRQYTGFGKVTSGMEFVDKIKKGDMNDNGKVTDPDKIVTLRVAADVEKDTKK